MAKTASRNLTTGSPTRLVIGFLLPLLGGLLFQQLYNMVDTLVVGRFLGMDALAGVGSTSSVNFLVLGFCIGICNGFVIPVAQKFGEGDEAELRRFVANSIWLSAAFAVVLTKLGVLANNSTGSKGAAEGLIKVAPTVGLNVEATALDIPVGSFDATSIALQMKNAGVDGLFMPLVTDSSVAIFKAVKAQ